MVDADARFAYNDIDESDVNIGRNYEKVIDAEDAYMNRMHVNKYVVTEEVANEYCSWKKNISLQKMFWCLLKIFLLIN